MALAGAESLPGLAAVAGQLGAGGGTPLLAAVQQAADWQARRQRLQPAEHQRL